MKSKDNAFLPYLSACSASYSTQHVLLRLIEEWKTNLDNNFAVGAVLMDLSKAFDCIPHDLLIAKLAAYGFEEKTLLYIYSYLENRKQCVKINNINSNFQTIKSGVPQGSIVGPILFNIFFNDFFFFLCNVSVHNFADDNTLSSFARTVKNLVSILESESSCAINWFRDNSMIVNPDKFQAILLDKRNSDLHLNENITIDKENIKVVSNVKMLGVHIDSKLNFNLHIDIICKSASNQLNALVRLKRYLGHEERFVLVNSFIYSNFNYCPLVWMFSSKRSLNKIENLQKRALRFVLDDYTSSYELLLEKSGKPTMNLARERLLCIEVYKTLNSLNPCFMQELFKLRETNRNVRNKYKLNLNIPVVNQVNYGTKSLRSFGPKIWNSLPHHVKSAENLETFKKIINNWNGVSCNCVVCGLENIS